MEINRDLLSRKGSRNNDGAAEGAGNEGFDFKALVSASGRGVSGFFGSLPPVRLRVTSAVLCFTLFFGLLTLVLPKKKTSASENRVLASFPAMHLSDLASGEWQSDLETWYSDHFVGRDGFTGLYRTVRRAMGQRDASGVYFGKNGHLFLIPTAPDAEQVDSLAAAISGFAAAHEDLRCCVAIAPNAVSIQSAYLPRYAEGMNQQVQLTDFYSRLSGVKKANLYAALLPHSGEEIYYRTDHHWTSLGAKYAFETVADSLAIEDLVSEYDTVQVSKRFSGTLAARSGVHGTYDSIDIWLPKTDVQYYVQYPDTGESAPSMYRREALSGRDQYAVFFGGNYGTVAIRTTASTGRSLLVFKDSYANAMMQFLYPYFEEIVMVDPRYFYDSLTPLLHQYAVTDVLWLYNADTFFSDTSLADVLNAEDAVPSGEDPFTVEVAE